MPQITVVQSQEAQHYWLHDLDFIDLYICLRGGKPAYFQSAAKGTFVVLPRDLPPAYDAEIAELRIVLEETLASSSEAAVTFNEMRMRVSKLNTANGEAWVALRRIEDKPPAIDQLGLTLPIAKALRQLGAREGLVLICGGTGQGKTTTASALLYDYLTSFGGVALTIEDPVEFMLDGRHGDAGLCYQVEVKKEEDWGEFLKQGLRWHPRYIMVGELRTPEAANQLLRAANSGHLVITTVHSGSLEEGLEAVLHLAEQAIGQQAATLLAAGLTAVLYQTFMRHSVHTRLYLTEEGNLGDPLRALIRERKIGQASTFIDQQTAKRDRT